MRKILMIVIMVLLIVLGFVIMGIGLGIGNFKILSIPQISEQNKQLEAKIEEVNNLNEAEFPKKLTDLKTASQNLEEAKKEYLKYTSLSSNDDILAAMQQKKYRVESLWVKLGTHARKEGVTLEFKIVPSSIGAKSVNDINFTVNGGYVAIINFVYAIENDTDLNFKIENFKISGSDILRATFNVRNVSIEEDTLSDETLYNETEDVTNKNSSETEKNTEESTKDNNPKDNNPKEDNSKDEKQNNVTNELEQANSNEVE